MISQNRKIYIGPSILSADFGYLVAECQQILKIGADSLHIDIMDGNFVPNLTIGPPVVVWLRKHIPHAHFDCHLMVTRPWLYIEPLAKIGVNCFTFHYESDYGNLKEICQLIRNAKMSVGLAVSPKTPIDATIQELIVEGRVDKILVMTVEPGFGGQKFMPETMQKVRYLREKFPELHIQCDGGIGAENAGQVSKSGANWLVSGSAIFGAKDRQQAINDIRNAATAAQI